MRPGMHGKTERSRSLIQMADCRERDRVSCSEDAYHREGWFAAWLCFSAIDRTDALCIYVCARVCVCVERVRAKRFRGKNTPGERGSRDEGRMAFVSSTLRFVGFSRLGDALSNLSAD